MWRLYIPPSTHTSFVRKPSDRAYTSTTHFLWENHLLMCWDQDSPIQPQESWSLAFPKLFSTQIIFHHSIICERELSVGETLAMLAWNVLWMLKLVLKLHLNLKNLKIATFTCWWSNHPPLDPSSWSFQLVSELWSPLLWFNHHWRKMDESTVGSIRRRVPMLDEEFYNSWKNEMPEIFN